MKQNITRFRQKISKCFNRNSTVLQMLYEKDERKVIKTFKKMQFQKQIKKRQTRSQSLHLIPEEHEKTN